MEFFRGKLQKLRNCSGVKEKYMEFFEGEAFFRGRTRIFWKSSGVNAILFLSLIFRAGRKGTSSTLERGGGTDIKYNSPLSTAQ